MRPVRTGLWLSVALTAFAVSVSVSLADSPTSPPMPRKDPKAAGVADTAAPEQDMDPERRKIRAAAALAAQQVLHRLEALETREPKPHLPWAKGLIPSDPVAIYHHVYRKPDGSLIPALGGLHPVDLRERLHQLAFTGRISKLEYIQFRNDILNIPLRLHAIPEESTYP